MSNIHERINTALATLPWPCRMHSASGTDDLYLTWYLLSQATVLHASGIAVRGEQTAQVSIFSRQSIVDELPQVIAALRAEGLKIGQAGPQGYDTETKYYLLPVIVRHAIKTDM